MSGKLCFALCAHMHCLCRMSYATEKTLKPRERNAAIMMHGRKSTRKCRNESNAEETPRKTKKRRWRLRTTCPLRPKSRTHFLRDAHFKAAVAFRKRLQLQNTDKRRRTFVVATHNPSTQQMKQAFEVSLTERNRALDKSDVCC